mmetsp:Transcript_64326/g.176550  ORF Transcript_64326/g.176550 Transcript_64326/m.176550 type:complete len:185 (+) Transcript_64326:79-633(+)
MLYCVSAALAEGYSPRVPPDSAESTPLLAHRLLAGLTAQSNLDGTSLQPCTQTLAADSVQTGFGGLGSCDWDESDTGYHEVCVTMTKTFIDNSARIDGNDLSSVTSAGGHWCICAWAFASAVERDPSAAEGLQLDCERTNGKLREIYEANAQLEGPTGTSYESAAALNRVNSICPKEDAAHKSR